MPLPTPRQPVPPDPLSQYQSSVNRAAVAGAGSRPRWSRTGAARPTAKPIRPAKNWGRLIRRSLIGVVSLAVIGGLVFVLTAGHGKFSLASLLGSAAETILGHGPAISGQATGRTNFLVYGMTEDGLRTDSIILVSYYWQQKKIVTLNVPRDLYVYDGYENDKMGEVYAYAKARQPKNPNYPDQYVAQVISKEYNVPINYWVQFNMQGEVDFVNALGGVDINVPNAFTDCQYPTWDYSGYVRPCPSFKAGEQHMNGATALIYSRSRHALQNGEGSDFARSKRQQLVIEAVMVKLKSMGIVGNITQISHYLNILGENLTTNMSTSEMVSFASELKNISPQTDYIKAGWQTGNGFLCDSSTTTGEYVTLYGLTPSCTLRSSGIGAGGYHDSEAREIAIYFVQHMLTSAPMTPQGFLTTAETALGYIKASPSPQSGSGTLQSQ